MPSSVPAAGTSKSQRAYQVIKARITDGDYGPGHRLVLGSLAKDLAVSPVPVREAIRLLEAEGLVRYVHNVGATVTAIDPVEYRHTMQVLAIVEGAATALAAPHVTAAGLAKAAGLNERMRDCLTEFDPVTFTRLNHEFHEVLYERCPNPELLDAVRRAWTKLAAIRESTFSFVPERVAASVAEHDQLLDLVRSGSGAEWIEHQARGHRTATLDAFLHWESGQHAEHG
ncbi:GntR family transcriptional regulator [Amycolatopsis sp. NPDC059021]|uniref:GntR family transcriptional regulator n=1 Tax=Amycolatopsis sp. NPDC059021 TaxID=3346704 RepID=UPI00366BC0D1